MEIEWLPYSLQAAALGLTAAASPGAFQTFMITQTLSGGWRRGAPVAFPPLLSDPLIVTTILLLLDQLPARFLDIISLIGGLFVIYMAWGLWKQWRDQTNSEWLASTLQDSPQTAGPNREGWRVLRRGALMNLLSPGPYTFWTLVVGPLFLNAVKQKPIYGGAFLVGFYTAFVGGMLGIVILFDQARRLGQRAVRVLTLASIVILVGFGIILIARAVM